ncbi:flagellin [Pelagibacterium sp. 26DY04]|uniref:flagellin N-terminal helical domain-containing protein n=1 Tax=Pelagibacterium sp. 26DY04 TaxID=2967130 RepID=UPI002815DC29|nr:flagellin [Pelagibacterium sp. 26DY04]WMT85729.1 flagellin [Pelagibacterium sp. 26DY04]
MMATTQNRLATGKKVNSALDNPTNFFTASSLNSRASDINALMDGMANGIQTIEAADNGLTAITKTLESMQSTLRQARQDKSFETASFSISEDLDTDTQQSLTLTGGAFGESSVTVDLVKDPGVAAVAAGSAEIEGGTFTPVAAGETATFEVNGTEVTLDETSGASLASAVTSIQQQLDDANVEVTVGQNADGDGLSFSSNATGEAATLEISNIAEDTPGSTGLTAGTATGTAAVEGARALTVDELVSSINNDSELNTNIRASNDNGNLRIENLSTQELTVGGASTTGVIDGTSSGASIGGNSVRADLSSQYNELRDQLDKLADDASFNGINLLRGDKLTITFNETDTSSLEIQSRIPNEDGEATSGLSINSASLGIKTNMEETDLDSDDSIDSMLADIKTAVNTVRSQASAFGSSLSIVENRQDFSKNMINTLETGASNLTLADANEEAANLLALQTRQQLSSTALSMASQQDQAVLRLF